FNVSRATFSLAPARLRERGIEFIQRDRGFMDSIYLRDPNGLKVELACYKFETPEGFRAVDVLSKAYSLRVERGDHHITEQHLAAMPSRCACLPAGLPPYPNPPPSASENRARMTDGARLLFSHYARLTTAPPPTSGASRADSLHNLESRKAGLRFSAPVVFIVP